MNRCRKTAAYKEQGDPGDPLPPVTAQHWMQPPTPAQASSLASRLCPNPHHRSHLERFPRVEREVGRSEKGRGTSEGNRMLRDLGCIKSYILHLSPPCKLLPTALQSPASEGDNLHKPRCTFGANKLWQKQKQEGS